MQCISWLRTVTVTKATYVYYLHIEPPQLYASHDLYAHIVSFQGEIYIPFSLKFNLYSNQVAQSLHPGLSITDYRQLAENYTLDSSYNRTTFGLSSRPLSDNYNNPLIIRKW